MHNKILRALPPSMRPIDANCKLLRRSVFRVSDTTAWLVESFRRSLSSDYGMCLRGFVWLFCPVRTI